jgi:type IV secretion system protein VirB9
LKVKRGMGSTSTLIFVIAICGVFWSSGALADKTPRPIATDVRIRQVAYSANEVYEIVGTYGYQTVIEFSETEEIKLVAIGDSIAWQAVPMGSRLFLKPVEADTATNLTVTTNKRFYYFNLVASRNKAREALTYTVRFVYSDTGITTPTPAVSRNNDVEIKPSGPAAKTPTDFNFNYQISGSKEISLVRAFDDGQFTYLQFAGAVDLPAVFSVDRDGKENLVNSRVEGQYVVIERVASQFTLRNGSVVTCLFNGNKPFPDTDFVARKRDLNQN